MKQYTEIIERIFMLLRDCSNPDLREPDGWMVKEILGHLVDSASHNHQRLARYTPGVNFIFPGYDQEECVRRAHYATFDFDSLLALWLNYNRLYLHIVAHIQPEHLDSPVTIGNSSTMTLGALIEDYFAHMQKHEQQLRRIFHS
jgi:hypothetical protein